jgi:hypothetical protein
VLVIQYNIPKEQIFEGKKDDKMPLLQREDQISIYIYLYNTTSVKDGREERGNKKQDVKFNL